MDIRQATVDDLIGMQAANLLNLPENYTMKYYFYHILTWPELSYVAVDPQGRITGYILSKMEEEPNERSRGHVTSISVLRPYRRLGLANRLMKQAQKAMVAHYGAKELTLHVRKSNRAAISLYKTSLGFEVFSLEKGYSLEMRMAKTRTVCATCLTMHDAMRFHTELSKENECSERQAEMTDKSKNWSLSRSLKGSMEARQVVVDIQEWAPLTAVKLLKSSSASKGSESFDNELEAAHRLVHHDEGYVPGRFEMVRDWLMVMWTRSHQLEPPILDPRLHRLFHYTHPRCRDRLMPDPRLFVVLSQMKDNVVSTPEVAACLEKSFGMIGEQYTNAHSWLATDNWSQAWLEVTHNLAAWGLENLIKIRGVLKVMIASLSACLETSLRTSQNRKTETEALFRSWISFTRVAMSLGFSKQEIVAVIQSIYLPTTVLRDGRSMSTLLGYGYSHNLGLPDPGVLPIMFEAMVSALKGSRYDVFQQPSSSKLPHDVFIAEKLRSAISSRLKETLDIAFDVSMTGDHIADSLKAEFDCWTTVQDLGVYLETEEHWGEVLLESVHRAQQWSHRHSEIAIALLAVLEGLDHGRSHLGQLIISRCLTATDRTYSPAIKLLSCLSRYHSLTHTMGELITKLLDALSYVFIDVSTASDANRLYALIARGPLFDPVIRPMLVMGLRIAAGSTERAYMLEVLTRFQSVQMAPLQKRRFVGLFTRIVTMLCDPKIEDDRQVIKVARDQAEMLLGELLTAVRKRKSMSSAEDTQGGSILQASIDRLTLHLLVSPFDNTLSNPWEDLKADSKPEASFVRAMRVFHTSSHKQTRVLVAESTWSDILEGIGPEREPGVWPGRQYIADSFELQSALLALLAADGVKTVTSGQLLSLRKLWAATFRQYGAVLVAVEDDKSIGAGWAWLQALMRDASVWESSTTRVAFNEAIMETLKMEPAPHEELAGILSLATQVPTRIMSIETHRVLLSQARELALVHRGQPTSLRLGLDCFIHLASQMIASRSPLALELPELTAILDEASRMDVDDFLTVHTQRFLEVICRSLFASPQINRLKIVKLSEILYQREKGLWPIILGSWLAAAMSRPLVEYPVELQDRLIKLVRRQVQSAGDFDAQRMSLPQTLRHFRLLGGVVQAERWASVNGAPCIDMQALLACCDHHLTTGAKASDVDQLGVLALNLLANLPHELFPFYLSINARRTSQAVDCEFGAVVASLDEKAVDIVWSQLQQIVRGGDALEGGIFVALCALTKRGSRLHLLPILEPLSIGPGSTGVAGARWLADVLGRRTTTVTELTLTIQVSWRLLTALDSHVDHFAVMSEILRGVNNMFEVHCNKVTRMSVQFCTLLSECIRHLCTRARDPSDESDNANKVVVVAHQLSRVLSKLRSVRPTKTDRFGSGHRNSHVGIFAKHIPSILVSYVRHTTDPRRALSLAVRRELEPGLWTICDIITSGGRMQMRGREGEGIGLPYGLGEGRRGEAEREIWAALWQKWTRQRYAGQG